MDEMTLGDYLRNLRNNKNVTTRELGDLIGYSYSYIASIETGKRKPREAVVEKYIYQLAYNSEELKKIKIDISNITNGEYYKSYLVNYDDSDSKKILSYLKKFIISQLMTFSIILMISIILNFLME